MKKKVYIAPTMEVQILASDSVLAGSPEQGRVMGVQGTSDLDCTILESAEEYVPKSVEDVL